MEIDKRLNERTTIIEQDAYGEKQNQFESNIDKIITTSDNIRYYVLDEIYRENRCFMMLAILDKEDNLTQEFSFVEKIGNDKIFLSPIENQDLLKEVAG